jgi:hypothetical protein
MRIDWNIAVQQRLLMALPFDGVWVADLSQSKFHNNVSVKSVTLTFRVVLNTVTITDAVMLSGDKNASQRTTRFEVDGLDHPHDDLAPGLIATVEWRGARFLHTVLRRPRVVETVTYEVSPDGGTLVNATNGPLGEQRIVYRRR